jgi:hypothetical protein
MSCIIAGFLIEYQLKWSQRCLRLLLLQASLIRDLMLPFPAYIGIDPSKRTYTPFLPLGMLAMFSLFRAHIVPYCLTIRMNSPFVGCPTRPTPSRPTPSCRTCNEFFVRDALIARRQRSSRIRRSRTHSQSQRHLRSSPRCRPEAEVHLNRAILM